LEGPSGGSFVAGKLEELEKALVDYYGAINELREGLNVPVPEMPEALEKLEQCEALGIPLVGGGVMDQPHIWLLEIGVIYSVKRTYAMVEQASQQQHGGDDAIPRI
jgi:hypothetical protein